MTCIVAIVENNHIHLGGDTCSTANVAIEQSKGKLWRASNRMVFGSCGDTRAANVLQFGFTPPARTEGQTLDAYMYLTFAQAVRAFLKEHIHVGVRDNSEDSGVWLLVGWHGRLWQLYPNYCLTESAEPYAAIGSGGEVALGALHTLHAWATTDVTTRLTFALDAAAKFCFGVRAPYTYLSTDHPARGGEIHAETRPESPGAHAP
ncbi:hypothetical protein [Deinococcus yunweiensis]|uniref:hypothetical protein n=1 Tax=Deinococcus yunweiensis TaxID=367282 RepID=UPI00398EE0BE